MNPSFSIEDTGALPFLDITAPAVGVQVEVSNDGTVLWVTVDGISVLRICRIPDLELPTRTIIR